MEVPLIPLPKRRRLVIPAALCALRYHSGVEPGVLRPSGIPGSTARSLRLREMFIGGGVAAHLACNCIQGQRGSAWRFSPFRMLFSLWSNYLILADAASDSRQLDSEASEALLSECLALILQPMAEVEDGLQAGCPFLKREADRNLMALRGSGFAQAALALARRLGASAAACLARSSGAEQLRGSFNLFSSRIASLRQGQIESLNQSRLDAAFGWEWYCSKVLDAKFTNILLGPLVLLALTEGQVTRRSNVERGIRLVNGLYLHRQLMDDLQDITEDCEDGILGGPAQLLLSLIAADGSADSGLGQPATDLKDLRPALALRIEALGSLRMRRERQRAERFRALWTGDRREAASVLLASDTVRELMAMFEDEQRVQPLVADLDELLRREPGVAEIIGFYYHRCARSYRRLKTKLARKSSS